MKMSYLLLLFFAVYLTACRKNPDTGKLSTDFVVQTSRSADANFQNFKTFFISDTIALATTNPNDSIWTDAKAKQLVATVKQNMTSRGYTLVNRNAKPDLGMELFAVKDLNVGVIYPGWWWGYWGYWGGCYWGYCGYPPYYPWTGMIYTVPTGTLILDMIDLKNATSHENLTVVWGSVMSGGIGTSSDLQLGVNAINQAFTQSAYLRSN